MSPHCSVKRTSPVVKAAIDTLREAEHRSMTPAPYWKIPGAYTFIPRQVKSGGGITVRAVVVCSGVCMYVEAVSRECFVHGMALVVGEGLLRK